VKFSSKTVILLLVTRTQSPHKHLNFYYIHRYSASEASSRTASQTGSEVSSPARGAGSLLMLGSRHYDVHSNASFDAGLCVPQEEGVMGRAGSFGSVAATFEDVAEEQEEEENEEEQEVVLSPPLPMGSAGMAPVHPAAAADVQAGSACEVPAPTQSERTEAPVADEEVGDTFAACVPALGEDAFADGVPVGEESKVPAMGNTTEAGHEAEQQPDLPQSLPDIKHAVGHEAAQSQSLQDRALMPSGAELCFIEQVRLRARVLAFLLCLWSTHSSLKELDFANRLPCVV